MILFPLILISVQPVQELPQTQTTIASETREPDCEWPRSFNDMNGCRDHEYPKAHFEIERAWSQANQAVSDYDDSEYPGADTRPMSSLLSRVHGKWLGYRDDHCESSVALLESNSDRGKIWSACMARLTSSRTHELREFAARIESTN